MATRFASLTFQARLTLVAAAAVAAAIIGPALVIYAVVHSVMYGQVDDSLRERAATIQVAMTRDGRLGILAPPPAVGDTGYVQVVAGDHTYLLNGETTTFPVTARDRQVALGNADDYFRSDKLNGTHLEIYTTRVAGGVAVQVIRPLTEVDRVLGYLRLVLVAVTAGGIALAALLGRLVAQAALAPIHRLREAVDHVTATQDMSERVPEAGRDELSRLASHFNRMLAALDRSLRTQRQLVADASHELRTPLASLRTNVEVLQRSPDMAGEERRRLLSDLVSQAQQLTRLVQDLIDLARGDQRPEALEDVRLDSIVGAAVDRAATHWPAVQFASDLQETLVTGEPRRIDRAVANLLDNAAKWSEPGKVVEVRVADHELVVRDHGPGIAPEDLPHVFDRFWRAPAARGMPGSGLGLAIVRQVAESHGASVEAELADGGGTLVRMTFPDGEQADSKVPLSRV